MPKSEKKNPWISLAVIFAVVVLIGMVFVSCLTAGSKDSPINGNVAEIELNGEITADGGSLLSPGLSSDEVVGFIKDANDNPQIKAILLRINSPGGSPVASEEIMTAVKNSSKPVVALIRDEGASGAYWVASAADGIVASPVSITGSIGVLGSTVEISGLMQKYGIGYERLVAGQYKDAGIPFRNLTPEEQKLLQERIDLIYDYFVRSVAENRHMDYNYTKSLATGIFYTGEQAKQLGLVDKLGGEAEAEQMLKEKSGVKEVNLVKYRRQVSLFDVFAKAISYYGYSLGSGLGNALVKDQFAIKT
ncbi:MAG: signal peptide peptidase SppA [Nanoarchaeota archaeon]|nr:MAG: signal peptide peptidase SppA [Nanoarchaeota archaeon]